VVSDNASTDRTREIVEEFAKSAPFEVKLNLNPTNLGIAKNFERAISLCSGDIIFLSDCDDVWLTEKLARVEALFLEYPQVALCVSDAQRIDENGYALRATVWQLVGFRPSHRVIDLSRECTRLPALGCSLAFRRGCVSWVMPIPYAHGRSLCKHDLFIAYVIAGQSRYVGLIDSPLLSYRQHLKQDSGAVWHRSGIARVLWRSRSLETFNEIYRSAEASLLTAAKRLEELGAEEFAIKCCREYASHMRLRSNLPSSNLKAVAFIARELAKKRYHRFSQGWRSAGADLFAKLSS
jgi:glycosyltransferase involved in cell wall biosynthesis